MTNYFVTLVVVLWGAICAESKGKDLETTYCSSQPVLLVDQFNVNTYPLKITGSFHMMVRFIQYQSHYKYLVPKKRFDFTLLDERTIRR